MIKPLPVSLPKPQQGDRGKRRYAEVGAGSREHQSPTAKQTAVAG